MYVYNIYEREIGRERLMFEGRVARFFDSSYIQLIKMHRLGEHLSTFLLRYTPLNLSIYLFTK